MPMSEYVRNLRAKIGTDLLFVCGANGIVVNDTGEILLHRRADNGRWWLPGGFVEPGEEPADAVVREVWEETGVKVVPERIVGVYGGPEQFTRYANGDQVAVLHITFACRPVGGEAHVNDDESLEVRYFAADVLPELDRRIRLRIDYALRYNLAAQFILKPKQGDTR
jgi:ADP-ribose pyrophosphatase YjhB (NUDIX family)